MNRSTCPEKQARAADLEIEKGHSARDWNVLRFYTSGAAV
jgi:hypothetical protein